MSLPKSWSSLSVSGVAVIALCLPALVQAEDAKPPMKSKPIEEIIVTAQKRAESAQRVSIAITAVKEELKDSNIRNLADLNGFAPNVRIDKDPGRANGVSINIRGVSPTRIDDNSLDAPVGVVVDGIYLGTLAGQAIENFDLDRIEILRGPQGTLFGRNTIGGVLNVVRSRPTGEFGLKGQITVGKWNDKEVRLIGNAPIIQDKLAVKGFVSAVKDDGYIKNTFTGRDMPKKDYKNFGITLLANPTDQLEALLTVERFKDASEGGASLTNFNLARGVSPKPSDPRETDLSGGLLACTLAPLFGAGVPCRTSLAIPHSISLDTPNPGQLDTRAYALTASFALSDTLKIVSVTGYRDMSEKRLLDFDGTSANHITIDRNNVSKQTSEELRLEGSWNDVTFVAGAYFWGSEFTQNWVTGGQFWEFISNLGSYSLANNVFFTKAAQDAHPGKTPVQACLAHEFGAVRCDTGVTGAYGPNLVQKLFENQKTTATALFGSADWAFAEKWTLTAGMRYTSEKKDFIAAQSYLAPLARAHVNNFEDQDFARLDKSWQSFSPKFAISYQMDDDVRFYASYAHGFHSGGFFGVNQNTKDFVRDQYDPEYAYSYETGMKGQFFGNHLQVNVAAFRNDFKDKQESSVQVDPSTNTVATVFSNAANARYQGLEVETQYVANDYVSLFANWGYLDAKYVKFRTDINPTDGIGKIEDASFLKPRNAPKNTFGVGGNVGMPIGPGRLSIGAKYSWVGEIEASLLNLSSARVKPRKNLSATISYVYENYSVSLYGRNLTDETFEIPAIIFPLFASGTIFPGRSWGLEVSADLGTRK